ncbi:MAG: hypothetical protein H0V01_02030 [Bacteroidetes bacterium]|nr:hypothetical protein [Bacteroidota bacterium]HET6245273.1 hypothetical protein [Bacteroidia bacterium]
MKSRIRNSILIKVIWGLLGLHFLNISVDSADPYPDCIPENLTINDQESIIEIVIEKILGFENAIKEYDDNDREDHTNKGNVKIELLFLSTDEPINSQPNHDKRTQRHLDFEAYLTKGFYQLDTPPPKI